MTVREQLNAIAGERVLVLDGAMGSMIQGFHLSEEDFRGDRFAGHPVPLKGCNDLLCLTRPGVISSIHEEYLKAGADIIETCSLNANAAFLGDYGLGDLAWEISRAAAALGRKAVDKFSTPERPRFVGGSMGPTARGASMLSDLNDPAARGITWDELEGAYYDNARGLLDGGADLLIVETIFDTLNAKAAVFAIARLAEERGIDVPVMISATVAGDGGRLLSGQTLGAFCASVLHANPWSLGLNCSFGAESLRPSVRELADKAPCLVHAYPNAGLPNHLGEYSETPASMAAAIKTYLDEGLVNIMGGCCGSTPAHIAALAALVKDAAPRAAPGMPRRTLLSGLKPLTVEAGPVLAGERTSVTGSREFRRYIMEEDYDGAVDMARDMVEQGAALINVCMDNPRLDAETAMTRFLNMVLAYPDAAAGPVMIESSRWEVIEAGLKCVQGKGLVNALDLGAGEDEFLRRARLVRRYGAAAVVRLLDEQGQARSYERKIAIAERSFRLLAAGGFPPEDLFFDPGVLPLEAGGKDPSAGDFLRACKWIREHCPGVRTAGGISNLSINFRGDRPFRAALHGVFLKHAKEAGLSLAIADPAALPLYDEIEEGLRERAEGVIFLGGRGGMGSGE